MRVDRSISIRTPESIRFSYDLAGLGSRFLAVTIDLLVQIAFVALIFWAVALAGGHAPAAKAVASEERLLESFAVATIVAIIFTVFFGYFILFEALWDGQTPGKKALGIRVVRDGGYPLDFGSSLIRNLVRVGEMLAGFYALGAISALLSTENKRLGDYAAGTIVVRDSRTLSPVEFLRSTGSAGFSLLNHEECALIERFAARRDGMDADRRARMAAQIADLVRPRLSRDLQLLSDEDLVTRLSDS